MRRPGKRLNSPERWEITQLIKAGVLDITEYPTFDEEGQARRALSRALASGLQGHAQAVPSPCRCVLQLTAAALRLAL